MNGQRLEWVDHVVIILMSIGIGVVAGALFFIARWIGRLYF